MSDLISEMAMSFATHPWPGAFSQPPSSNAHSSSASQPYSVRKLLREIASIVPALPTKVPSHNSGIGIDQAVTYGVRDGRKQLDRRYEILLTDQMLELIKNRSQISLTRGDKP